MEGEANSWIWRTKFSHTVCHRLDALRLASLPLTIQPDRIPGAKSRPRTSDLNQKPEAMVTQIQQNSTTNKNRSVSPHPETKVSDAFKEAQSSQKRFLTPLPQRRGAEKGIVGRLFRKDSCIKAPNLNSPASKSPANISPLRHFASIKFHEKTRSCKESAWTKYFDHSGGRVTSVETGDEFTVDLSELFLGLRFAHGAHSQLYHGIYKEQPVAVKIIRVPDDDENGDLGGRLVKQFTREATLLSSLHHENVIKFVAACRKPPVFCIITEYLSEGSLRSYLHNLEHRPVPLQKLIALALDIARGMEYIHSQGVIHRDLKPENILINEDFRLKVADFGIACEGSYCDLLADDPGTYRWMAPEMIRKKHYGRKVDVYGFGLILWEFVAGTIPYEDMTAIQAAFAVVNKNLRPAIPEDCPLAMRALIDQCWSVQPDKRPEFWQIVKVLEQFESSLARDGTLNLIQNRMCQDHEKGLRRWIQKLGPLHHNTSPIPKPKFSGLSGHCISPHPV